MALVPFDPETGKPVPGKDRQKWLDKEKAEFVEARDHEGRMKKQLAEKSKKEK